MNQPAQQPPPREFSDPYLNDGPIWLGISRGIAGFFGLLCILEAFRALLTNQMGSDFGWIDLSPCPPLFARGLMAFSGTVLVLFCLTHRLPNFIRLMAMLGVMAIFAIATGNAVSIHRSIQSGVLQDGVPMSAHVVTLLVPVLFGIMRGTRYGPLRFPVGGALLLLSLTLSAGAFSVGYVLSLSKFHQPQASDTIVVMHPREVLAELSLSPHAAMTEKLVRDGYSGRVLLVQQPESTVPPLVVGDLQRTLPVGTEVRVVAASNDEELAAVLATQPRAAYMFVGDQVDAPRMRLIGQRAGGRVSFVSATTSPFSDAIVGDIQSMWRTWFEPFATTRKETPRLTGIPVGE